MVCNEDSLVSFDFFVFVFVFFPFFLVVLVVAEVPISVMCIFYEKLSAHQ